MSPLAERLVLVLGHAVSYDNGTEEGGTCTWRWQSVKEERERKQGRGQEMRIITWHMMIVHTRMWHKEREEEREGG